MKNSILKENIVNRLNLSNSEEIGFLCLKGDTIVVDLYLGLNVILDNQYMRLYGIDAWETGSVKGFMMNMKDCLM